LVVWKKSNLAKLIIIGGSEMRFKKILHLLGVFVLMGCLLSLAGGVNAFAAKEAEEVESSDAPQVTHWTIPSIGAFTGPGAWIGVDSKFALDRAVRDINAVGGIRGLPVVIENYDTGGFNPDKAVQMFAKAEPGALVIVGPIASSENVACGPIAAKAGICYLGTGSSDWSVIVDCAPWMFTPYASCYDDTAEELSVYLKKVPGIDTICMIYSSAEEYTKEVGDKTLAVAEKNGVKVKIVDVPLNTVDFGPIAAKAVTTKPDAYLLACYAPFSASIIKELRKLGVTDSSKIVTTAYAFSDSFFAQGGQDLDGTYVIDTYDPDYPSEKWKKFLSQYRAEVGGVYPQNVVRFQYDFAWMIKDAIEELKITGDPKKLEEERIAIRNWFYSMKDWQGIACTYTCYPIAGGCPQHAYLFKMDGNVPVLVPGSEIQAKLPDWVVEGQLP
jgi:branched-chain amino acid transport system substrate-binding protein